MDIIEEKGWTVTYIPWEDMKASQEWQEDSKLQRKKMNFLERFINPILVG